MRGSDFRVKLEDKSLQPFVIKVTGVVGVVFSAGPGRGQKTPDASSPNSPCSAPGPSWSSLFKIRCKGDGHVWVGDVFPIFLLLFASISWYYCS